ncbi:hypothetical protein MATL_G00040000 [Megalops atlanticus]|uniref:Uncharacterized protein n=1 Tax=Megalops atlanticus TaxID=7932 RepID=A0A9D3TGK1_MEGAT|nr:hypothetical protein MATL_G00040000 [Megalops atlanticus]
MTAYLNKQQSCCRDGDGRGMELALSDAPCACSWQHEPHGYYHPGPASPAPPQHAGATLPRQRGKLTATRSESMWRSPSRGVARAKAGSCDLWAECGCQHGWHDPYQVKPPHRREGGNQRAPWEREGESMISHRCTFS